MTNENEPQCVKIGDTDLRLPDGRDANWRIWIDLLLRVLVIILGGFIALLYQRYADLEVEMWKMREWKAATQSNRFTNYDAIEMERRWIQIFKDEVPPKEVLLRLDRLEREVQELNDR